MPDDRTANLLGALALIVGDDLARAAEEHGGRRGSAPAALVTIGTYPGRAIEEYSRALGLTHSGVVRLVDRLEADGIVERRRGYDARSVTVHPTPVGEARVRAVLAERMRVLRAVLGLLSPEEQGQLERVAEKLLSALTTSRNRADRICRLCDLGACPQDVCPVEVAAREIDAGKYPGPAGDESEEG